MTNWRFAGFCETPMACPGNGGRVMSDFGSNFIIITDEDGKNYELEHLFTFDLDGEDYAVFLPAGEGAESDSDMILFHVVYENGEEEYENISDDIYDRVYEKFMDILFETE